MKNVLQYRRVLVTGATGMVGAHLTLALEEQGADVVALVRDYTPHSYLLSGPKPAITIVSGDLQDYRLLERTIAEYEIEVVFHLGAQTIVPTANRSPLGTFKSNIEGTWNVLESCRQSKGIKAIVIASSDKAYGPSEVLPYTEAQPLQGKHPYDVSKSCADLISTAYWATYGLPITILRCGNIFGPGDLNLSRLVPGTIRAALCAERPIIRSDGSLVRDYFYVKDAVEAYLLMARSLLEKPERIAGEAFNFSNERQMTVLEMTRLVLKVMKRPDLKPIIENTAKAEIERQSLSAEKARRVLGWSSRYSLELGIQETAEFVKSVLVRPMTIAA